MAALEAMASEVPVIGSRAGGLPEVVVEGETGYLLPVGDVEVDGRPRHRNPLHTPTSNAASAATAATSPKASST